STNAPRGLYFWSFADLPAPAEPKWYRDFLSPDQKNLEAADEYSLDKDPRHASMLRTSISPNEFNAGYRSNVIPSEAKARLDVRTLPDEDPVKFLEQVKKVINDPAIDAVYTSRDTRPPTPVARLASEAFKAL